MAGSAYLTGAVLGALFFGWLTDRLGRKRLFFITLAVYLIATAATATSWNLATFILFRFFTGAGIGGEYAAINSTIQELTPARVRGWTDLVTNGSFWIGAVLALFIFFMRFWIPESPRWLMTHGRVKEADAIMADIDERVRHEGHDLPPADLPRIRLRLRDHTSLLEVARTLFREHRQRTLVGLSLMAAQAFFYNAIFFTYALILTDFYGIPSDRIGWYILPFAAGNFLGPVMLGRLFDTVGRRRMIAFTYATSGILLAVVGYLFMRGALSATTQTIGWTVIFFFASSAASSAYLTVSETFPLEIRALAIAVFYAIGTGIGGIIGPLFFGVLIQSGSRASVFIGYLSGSLLMILAALIAGRWAVAAERKSLETVAPPLASVN
jgi:MFS family permease